MLSCQSCSARKFNNYFLVNILCIQLCPHIDVYSASLQ